jgi:hypothetical protein
MKIRMPLRPLPSPSSDMGAPALCCGRWTGGSEPDQTFA